MSTDVAVSAEDKVRYDTAKKELIQALTKKRAVDKQLAQLEVQIYNFENSYLTDTNAHSGGNIIQGFDGYLKNQSVTRRRFEPQEHDRIFSNSSLSYQKSMEMIGEGDESILDESNAAGAMKVQPSGLTTVVLPPASRTQELNAAQQKKIRDKEYQRRKRASMRSTVSGEDDPDGQNHRRPTKRARGEE